MSGDIADPAQCDAIADELAELALETLSGCRRSEVLRHVGWCLRCRAELEQLSLVSEAVQQLAPQVPPPLGFESRLAERLRGPRTSRQRRLRRVGALSAAAVVMMLAFGVGVLVARGDGNGKGQLATANLLTANFTSGGRVVGAVVISPGSPAWMLVTIQQGTWQGKVTCEATLAGGAVETIGAFKLSGEYSSWAAPLMSNASQVRSARLIDSNGHILASAQLGT